MSNTLENLLSPILDQAKDLKDTPFRSGQVWRHKPSGIKYVMIYGIPVFSRRLIDPVTGCYWVKDSLFGDYGNDFEYVGMFSDVYKEFP